MSTETTAQSTKSELLNEFKREAERMRLCRQQTLTHIDVECTGNIDDVLGTLANEGPYAYTRAPDPGTPWIHQEFATNKDGIRSCYEDLATKMLLVALPPVTEIVTSWYDFYHSLSTVRLAETGELAEIESVVAFPTKGTTGITGEVFWARRTEPDATGGEMNGSEIAVRRTMMFEDERRLDALRRMNPAAFAGELVDAVQMGLRDLRGGDGYIDLHSRSEVQRYLESVFATHEIVGLDVLQRHVAEWYVFTETLWNVRERSSGHRLAFRSFHFCDLDAFGKVICHFGHSTDSW
jgi:hypothetical protein